MFKNIIEFQFALRKGTEKFKSRLADLGNQGFKLIGDHAEHVILRVGPRSFLLPRCQEAKLSGGQASAGKKARGVRSLGEQTSPGAR
jgi:hypothetical protein